MKLHTLPPLVAMRKKRLGHGYGSGQGGHTSSRGQKGQKSRNGVRLSFTGSSWVWFKRLPFMRGKSRFNSFGKRETITLAKLNSFKSGSVVTADSLAKVGIISRNQSLSSNLKIVAGGRLSPKLTVKIKATKGAQAAIIKAGGEYSATD